ncbi:P63C domain-containing protein [Mesorhizobium sp. M0761]|uniref:P63C domain-containing protein n=1 Tax=unclassified Mesorhizobium TaxID=325217 RepID=UPI00333CCBFC
MATKKTPQSLGGSARADKLSADTRTKIARNAALARHAPKVDLDTGLPLARSEGVLPIGDVNIDVYVLWDRRRLVSKRAMAKALGLKSEGGNAFLKTLSGKTIGSIIPDELWEKIKNHIEFKPLIGDPGHGYEATVLIEVCDALIEGRDKLLPSQMFLARQAEIIMRSAAKIGIIALIDEATGFIEDKRREEYRNLWQEFIRDEFRQWEDAEFPDDIFDMMYKLYGLKRINPNSSKHPRFFAKFLRKYIYVPLANSNGGILEQLEEKNPVVYANGGRRFKLFQFLSDEVGLPALRQHMWQVVGIGRSVKTKEQFERSFYSAFPEALPRKGDGQLSLFDD